MTNKWIQNRSSDRFYFLGLQNHCGLWCNHENKRCLLLGRNAMTNLDSVLKSRGTSLLKKVHIVKNYGTHSSTLAWKLPWMEEPGSLQSMGSWRLGHDWATHFHFSLSCIGKRNGNPLQCSCLRIPGIGEPGGLPSMGLHRVRHDRSDLAAAALCDLV